MEFYADSAGKLIELLGERYGRKRSSLYEWLRICGITSIVVDGKYTYHTEDLAKLDRLNEWVQSGNKAFEFPERVDTSAIATVETQEIEQAATTVEAQSMPMTEEFQQLLRVAQEKGAGLLMAQNLLAQQFAQSPEALPPDLLQAVRETEKAIAPKSQDPMQYANRFIQLATA